jgi:hypoxanthine phosphoribosyltransferase
MNTVNKIYLSADNFLRDSWRLARLVMDSGWIPDHLLVLWRGGAPVGMAIHEFFSYHGITLRHQIIKCHSYTGINTKNSEVRFEHADAFFKSLQEGERLLVVDDVFDSGMTARAVYDRLAVCDVDFKFATVYWKPRKNKTTIKPDFHVRQTEEWIVFPHEMDGLTRDEIAIKDPELYTLLKCGIPLSATKKVAGRGIADDLSR